MLKLIDESNIECYKNLSQHYEAEFSVLTGKKPDTNGLYEITNIDENHKGYLFYSKEELPVGFVVVDTSRVRYDIAEFYVIPNERRKGLGRIISFEVFDIHQGHWQVRQINGADKAFEFWVSIIDKYSQGNFTNEIEKDVEWGRVRIQRFNSR